MKFNSKSIQLSLLIKEFVGTLWKHPTSGFTLVINEFFINEVSNISISFYKFSTNQKYEFALTPGETERLLRLKEFPILHEYKLLLPPKTKA